MKKQTGQSLLELVVALGVAMVILLALVQAVVAAVRNASFAKSQVLTTQYANKTVEEMRSYRDQHTWAEFVANCESPTGLGLGALPAPFTGARTIDCYLPGTANNCSDTQDSCEVKTTLVWTDARGVHQSVLKTRLTNWK